jgi:hypothetical protein
MPDGAHLRLRWLASLLDGPYAELIYLADGLTKADLARELSDIANDLDPALRTREPEPSP